MHLHSSIFAFLPQDKQAENKRLQQKIDSMEKAVKDMQEKFEYADSIIFEKNFISES